MPFLLTTTVPQPSSLRLLAIGARLARGATSRPHRRKTKRSIGFGLGILVLVLGAWSSRATATDIMVSQVPDFQSAGLVSTPHHYGGCAVKDVDFTTNQITIRDGKGHKDRATMLPASVKADLSVHLERVRRQHEGDLRHGAGWVELPGALLASTRTPAEPGDGSGSSRRLASMWTA
jgi:hypothetical protein